MMTSDANKMEQQHESESEEH